MNTKLLHVCALLWVLGLLGMCVTRTLLELETGALACQLAARLLVIGGLGYTGLGLVAVRAEAPSASARARRTAETEADLSAWIRRR